MTALLHEPRDGSVPIAVDLSEPGEYQKQLIMAYQIAQFIRAMPLQEMVIAIGRAESIAPIIDPSLWMGRNKAMSEDKEILEILAFAQRKLAAIHARGGR